MFYGCPGTPQFGHDRGLAAGQNLDFIAGLNLAQYPSILVELGNMKNPVDSSLMESPDGRQKYADAVVRGVVAFLQTQPARTS